MHEAQDVVYEYFRSRLKTLRQKYGRPGEKAGFTRLDGRDVRSFRDVLATACFDVDADGGVGNGQAGLSALVPNLVDVGAAGGEAT